ncbi:lysine--tRNA ligase [SAR86 cluster bacterium]|nr:lysine--tRNA ligase [SAR86 cluster bacterium]
MSDIQDENHLIEERKKKLKELKKSGINYPNSFRRSNLSISLIEDYSEFSKEELTEKNISVSVAGRIMLRRVMGKASFSTIQDMTGRIQLYLRQDAIDNYELFIDCDLGDIVGAKGVLFKTNTGELSIQVNEFNLLTKSLRPLPEKHLGLSDVETKYRKRYLDLLTNSESQEVFEIRSKVVNEIRQFLIKDNFIEVETPMMHPIPGGATAKPFVTHHNALDMELFLRVAPELYLKRLVIGGMEKVFEINRNFRNEGLSTKHNPEFTMLEFYTAYVDYKFQMDFVENMLRTIEKNLNASNSIFSNKFHRFSMDESIANHNTIDIEELANKETLVSFCEKKKIKINKSDQIGNIKNEIFEATVEDKLIEPTFIYNYPIEISPLSRSLDEDNSVAERFELFVNGKELGNSFSELNDPEEQAARFESQVKEKDAGDEEAMHFDKDYIEALEYGLAPCAGVGIGIDRLVMLFTGQESIRDVVLFPQLRNK